MEIFWGQIDESAGYAKLEGQEAAHCVKVLRHRYGDEINVIDGGGDLYVCKICEASPKEVNALIINTIHNWNAHPYKLVLGVAPTKNADRFEWFVEKAVELGVDEIYPLVCERSERRRLNAERLQRVALAAVKQSLKAKTPLIGEEISFADFLRKRSREPHSEGTGAQGRKGGLRMIAHCMDGKKFSILRALEDYFEKVKTWEKPCGCVHTEKPLDKNLLVGEDKNAEACQAQNKAIPEVTALIGPEGDFSPSEAQMAIENGYVPIHLGPSRLRTETAAVSAVEAVYLLSSRQ